MPAVSIGSRQNDRERGKNVLNAKYESTDILKKINIQLNIKKFRVKSNLYGDGNASNRISKILENIKVDIQKRLDYK